MPKSALFLFLASPILAIVKFACAEALTNSGQEVKQHGRRKAGDAPAQNNQSNERCNMQFSGEKSGGITKFEKFPADEEQMIKDMESIPITPLRTVNLLHCGRAGR